MLPSTLREHLESAVKDVTEAAAPAELEAGALRICEVGRALNFGLAREFSPDGAFFTDVANELEAAARAIQETMDRLDLTDEEVELAQVLVENTLGRAEDMRENLATSAELQAAFLLA